MRAHRPEVDLLLFDEPVSGCSSPVYFCPVLKISFITEHGLLLLQTCTLSDFIARLTRTTQDI